MNIPLLVAIIFATFRKMQADSCVAKEVKSSQGIYVRERYDFHHGWIAGHYQYPTLYVYIACENVTLQAGQPLNILNRQTNELFNYIIFKNSTLSVIPVGVFPSSITVIEAFMNASKIHTIEPGAFSGLLKLEKLHLEDNAIAEIARGTLNSLINIKTLDLSKNHLLQIEDNSLHGLLALEELNLSLNNLKRITTLTFNSLNTLKSLDLSYNRLSEIAEGSFTNTRNLQKLTLNDNFLSNISMSVFHNITSLRVLNMSFNEIQDIDFNFLPSSLIKVDFSNNVVNDVKNWSNLQNIQTVDLRQNRISEISAIGKGIVYLYLGGNNLESLDSFVFRRSDTLIELDLNYNSIQEIATDSFKGLSKLKYLYLDHNRLKELPIGCFRDLINLQYLYLSYNSLTNLEFGTFAGLSNLNDLSLNNNKLIVLHESSFYVLRKLKMLEINDNEINSIQAVTLLTHLKGLKSIVLNNNNWTCNSLLSIVTTFKNGNVHVDEGVSFHVPNVDGIACTNEINIKADTDDVSSTAMTDINISTASGFDTATANSLSSFSDDFHNSGFYKFLDQGFKNSSFYNFFNSNWMDNFANYMEKRFNNSFVFNYFEKGFTNSSFYTFFNNDFSKQLQMHLNNIKILNEDAINSTVYNIFNKYFKNSGYFKDYHMALVRKLENSSLDSRPEFLKQSNSEALKINEMDSARYIELIATKLIILISVIVSLMLINTLIIMFLVVRYHLHLKQSKSTDCRLITEADMELI